MYTYVYMYDSVIFIFAPPENPAFTIKALLLLYQGTIKALLVCR